MTGARLAVLGVGAVGRSREHLMDRVRPLGRPVDIAVTWVHRGDRLRQTRRERMEALYEPLARLPRHVRAAERPVSERAVVVDDDIARVHALVANERNVVRRVPRRFDDPTRLVSDEDRLAVCEGHVTLWMITRGEHHRVEALRDRIKLGDMIAVLVGDDDLIERVDVCVDHRFDARHRPGVNECRPIAVNEVRVTGERRRVGGDDNWLHSGPTRSAQKSVRDAARAVSSPGKGFITSRLIVYNAYGFRELRRVRTGESGP